MLWIDATAIVVTKTLKSCLQLLWWTVFSKHFVLIFTLFNIYIFVEILCSGFPISITVELLVTREKVISIVFSLCYRDNYGRIFASCHPSSALFDSIFFFLILVTSIYNHR